MKKYIVVALLFFVFILVSCTPRHFPEVFEDINQYQLEIYLDTESSSLVVSGKIEYINEMNTLDELYIMLFPNAANYSNREYNIVMDSLKIDNKEVPFEYANEDDTAMYISLDKIYNEGDIINIEFSYEFNYWEIDRILAVNNYYLTMFFYPFVAVHDESGWNIDEYSFSGETYYNTIGDYDVTINVPSDYLIASSGWESSSKVVNNRLINRYSLFGARDFSFSASSQYVMYEREMNGMKFYIYARGGLTLKEQNNSFEWLSDSFELYNDLFGGYNQDHFTLEYGYIYGMESTGIIYCSEDIDEGTVVHEVVHQWFYSMIGNNQFDLSFLDETLTTFSSALYYRDKFGVEGYNDFLDYQSSLRTDLSTIYGRTIGNSLLSTVTEMEDLYAIMIYYHGPSMIRYYIDEFLEGDIDQFVSVIDIYFDMYNGKIATLDNFLDLLEDETGVSNTKEWFLMQLNSIQDFDNRP